MKYLFVITFFIFSMGYCHAAIDDNVDYNFIDNAFVNSKGNVNSDFEKLMQEYEKPKRDGLFQKMYKFFDSDKVKYDEEFKKKYKDSTRRINDVPEDKPTVLIPTTAQDSKGNVINTGYYQIKYKNDNGKHTLELTQGGIEPVIILPAREIEEDEGNDKIMYGRAETTKNGFIKIIYSNLDLTLAGYLKIIEEKNENFEQIY